MGFASAFPGSFPPSLFLAETALMISGRKTRLFNNQF
jgi:hypothetical protein